jgi:hypothetical protein
MTSIQWIDDMLSKHSKKEWRHSGTRKTFEQIFIESISSTPLPFELMKKMYFLFGKHATRKGIIHDIVTSNTYCGHVWFGFTSFGNSHVISFKKPNENNVGGHAIQWTHVVSVHKMHSQSPQSFCLHFDLKPSIVVPNQDDLNQMDNLDEIKKTFQVTVEDDCYSLHSLILLYKANREKYGCPSRAIEISKARKLLVDFHFDLVSPAVNQGCSCVYFRH